jgi:hypothetical protein
VATRWKTTRDDDGDVSESLCIPVSSIFSPRSHLRSPCGLPGTATAMRACGSLCILHLLFLAIFYLIYCFVTRSKKIAPNRCSR